MKNSPFQICNLSYPTDKLRDETIKTLVKYGKFNKHISLTHVDGEVTLEERLFGKGVTEPRDSRGNRRYEEKDFTHFNPEFEGTIFHSVWKEVNNITPIGRMRLATLGPSESYHYHADDEMRFQMALITNPYSFFIVGENSLQNSDLLCETRQVYHMPANGKMYQFNARIPHTAGNFGKTPRTHLVITQI